MRVGGCLHGGRQCMRLSPVSDLVVVGAGPTGLTLALQASKMGAKVRIFERRTEPSKWAPALAVHPRTMEILRGLGVADELLTRGLSKVDLAIHSRDATIEGSLGDLHLPATEFPFVFFAPQPEVEAVLTRSLEAVGVSVEGGPPSGAGRRTRGGSSPALTSMVKSNTSTATTWLDAMGLTARCVGRPGFGSGGGDIGSRSSSPTLLPMETSSPGRRTPSSGRRASSSSFLFRPEPGV